MSKPDKTLAKIKKRPIPKDISWRELVNLLESLGYVDKSSGGGSSHHKFIKPGKADSGLVIPRPPGGTSVKPVYLKLVVEALKDRGEGQ